MIRFICPGCQHSHKANPSFAGLRAKCIRCGAAILIPKVQQKSPGPSKAKEDEFNLEDDLSSGGRIPSQSDHSATYPPIDEAVSSSVDSDGTAELVQPSGTVDDDNEFGSNLDGSDNPDLTDGSSASAFDDPADEESHRQSTSRKKRGKLNPKLVFLMLLLIAGGGAVYYFFFRKAPSIPTPKKTEILPQEEMPEQFPPPYEFVGPILPPAPPPEPIRMNAEQLNAELARDFQATNAKYAGKLMELQGECERFQSARLTYRVNSTDSQISAVLPIYLSKFRDEDGKPIAPASMPALLGGWYTMIELPPEIKPIPGRPVAVRGVYRSDGEMIQADLVRLQAPADELYLGKMLTVVGKVAGDEEDENGLKQVTFAKWSSSGFVDIRCRMTKLATSTLRVKTGDTIAITGKCSGRKNYRVWLENCSVLKPGGNPLSALKLAADHSGE
jgi:hypothetical protein